MVLLWYSKANKKGDKIYWMGHTIAGYDVPCCGVERYGGDAEPEGRLCEVHVGFGGVDVRREGVHGRGGRT